jgi:hypothetical protein
MQSTPGSSVNPAPWSMVLIGMFDSRLEFGHADGSKSEPLPAA